MDGQEILTGRIVKSDGKFGFIKPDNGEGPEMFVMPKACAAFGGVLPPLHTQVAYSVVTDIKTGRPRAEHVQRGGGGRSGPFGPAGSAPQLNLRQAETDNSNAAQETLFAYAWGQHLRKPLVVELEEHRIRMGLSDEECCQQLLITNKHGRGLRLPVNFDQIEDQFPLEVKLKVSEQPPMGQAPMGNAPTGFEQAPIGEGALQLGTMHSIKVKFGFIKQDSGESDMFVMPAACKPWGGELPPLGARMQYRVVIDTKTGRPRADDVSPADDAAVMPPLQINGLVCPSLSTIGAYRPSIVADWNKQPMYIGL